MTVALLFKDLVWDLAIKSAISRLFIALPFLTWGPLGPIVTWIITKIADRIYTELETAVALETISFKNRAHRAEFDEQSVRLKIIAHDKGIESVDFKREREVAKEKLSRFVRYS